MKYKHKLFISLLFFVFAGFYENPVQASSSECVNCSAPATGNSPLPSSATSFFSFVKNFAQQQSKKVSQPPCDRDFQGDLDVDHHLPPFIECVAQADTRPDQFRNPKLSGRYERIEAGKKIPVLYTLGYAKQQPQEKFGQILGYVSDPTHTKPEMLPNGKFKVEPLTNNECFKDIKNTHYLMISRDNGKTWTHRSCFLPKNGVPQEIEEIKIANDGYTVMIKNQYGVSAAPNTPLFLNNGELSFIEIPTNTMPTEVTQNGKSFLQFVPKGSTTAKRFEVTFTENQEFSKNPNPTFLAINTVENAQQNPAIPPDKKKDNSIINSPTPANTTSNSKPSASSINRATVKANSRNTPWVTPPRSAELMMPASTTVDTKSIQSGSTVIETTNSLVKLNIENLDQWVSEDSYGSKLPIQIERLGPCLSTCDTQDQTPLYQSIIRKELAPGTSSVAFVDQLKNGKGNYIYRVRSLSSTAKGPKNIYFYFKVKNTDERPPEVIRYTLPAIQIQSENPIFLTAVKDLNLEQFDNDRDRLFAIYKMVQNKYKRSQQSSQTILDAEGLTDTSLDAWSRSHVECGGYALVFAALARAAGYPTKALSVGDYRHAWNEVYAKDPDSGKAQWYVIDSSNYSEEKIFFIPTKIQYSKTPTLGTPSLPQKAKAFEYESDGLLIPD